MRYIEDLIPLRLYSANKKVWVPHNVKDRKRNAAIFLLGKTPESSTKLMNLPYIYNPNLFTSYYVNRDITAYVTHEGTLVQSLEEKIGYDVIREGFYHGNEHHIDINIIGDASPNDVRLIKKSCNEGKFSDFREVINVDVSDTVNIIVYKSVSDLRKKAPKLYKNSNSYTVANNIHVLLPSAYKENSMDGKYDVYMGHEMAMLMIYKINSKCNPVLAEYIAGYACGQTKLEDDYLYKNGLDVSGSKVIEKIVEKYGAQKINAIIRHSDIAFVSNYASKNVIKNITTKLTEAGMTTAERNSLDSSEFGIPSERKYPLNDESHVRYAIKLFGHVEPKYEKQLATAIKHKIKQYGMTVDIGQDNKLSKYIHEGVEIAYLSLDEAEEVIMKRMVSANVIGTGSVEAVKKLIDEVPDENTKAILTADLKGFSALNTSAEDSDAKTTPENVDKEALNKILNRSTFVVKAYKEYQNLNLDWIIKNTDDSGNMRDTVIITSYNELKGLNIPEADIREYLLSAYFDTETDPNIIKQSLRMRLGYIQRMENIYTEMLKLNYQLFGISMQDANALLKKDDKSLIIKVIKKAIDANPSKFIVKNGCIDYKPIGGGVLFTATDPNDMANLTSICKASHFINLSMDYDCIIFTHGGSAPKEDDPSKNTWILNPPVYTMQGGPYSNMYELTKQCIREGYKNILLYACNPGEHSINDDPEIAKAHVKITYGTNIVNAESSNNTDPTLNTINEAKRDVLNICNEYGIDYDDDYTLYESYKFVEKNKDIVTEGIGSTVWTGLKNFIKKIIESLVYLFKTVINAFKSIYGKIKTMVTGKENDKIKELTVPIIMKEGAALKDVKVHSVAELEKYFISNCQALTDEMKAFQNRQMMLVKKTEALIDKRAKETESSTNESAISSKLDNEFKNKKYISLNSLKEEHIDENTIEKYKSQCKGLSHVRTGKGINGNMYTKDNKLVCYYNSESKPDGVWIQALEIVPEYQGHGLSAQLISKAFDYENATKLSVNKKNEVAIKIYLKAGFKTFKETDSMLFMELDTGSSVNESTFTFIGNPSKHRFMYHLVPKGTDVSEGIVSPYFLKKEKRYDELDKLLDTYRDKLCGIWGRYPDSYPADLTRDQIIDGLKGHRGHHGDQMIFMFAFPPKTELNSKNMGHILKTHDAYRIDLGKIPDGDVAEMRWGNVISQRDAIAMPDEMFDRMKVDGYYTSMYDDEGQLSYKSLTHLGLAMKSGMIEPKYFEKVIIPDNLIIYTEDTNDDIEESCRAPIMSFEEQEKFKADGYIMTEDYLRVKNEGHDNIFYFNEDAEIVEDDFVDDESDTSYNALIRRYLYRNRIKNNKELIEIYNNAIVANPWIRTTYLKLGMYKKRNLYIDLSYYHNQFLSHITYKMDKAVNMYWDFLNRLMDNADINNQYGTQTYFIPIDPEDWNVSSAVELWDYKKSLNPISAIFRLVRTNPTSIKQKWGNKRIIFCSNRGYFTVDFSEFEIKNLARFKMNVGKLYSMEEIIDEPGDEDDTPETSDVVSSIEKTKAIDLTPTNTVKEKPKEKPEPIPGISKVKKVDSPDIKEDDLTLVKIPMGDMIKGTSQVNIISPSMTSTAKILNSSYFNNRRSIKKIIKGK